MNDNSRLVGIYSAFLTAVITLITFGFAMIAVPVSGANCPANCVNYPYMDTLAQYPRDFIWMYLALVMILAYLVLMVAIHNNAPDEKKIFSQIGLIFAAMTTLVLLTDYFLQVSIVPVSLMNGELEGLPLLIQYNSHGVFLAMEELGYLLMALSFLFIGLTFSSQGRLEAAIRWIFIGSFVLVMVSLAVVSGIHGLEKLDRFEVMAISINWLALIVNGILLGIFYRRIGKEK